MARLNPDVRFEARPERLSGSQCRRLARRRRSGARRLGQFRHPPDRLRPCTAARIPLVSAAIGQFQAQIGTFRGWEADRPCYRCFVGDAFDAEDCDSCSELGVLGAMAGIAGSFAALEAIRAITGFGEDPAGKLHIFDGLKPAMRTIRIAKDPACRGCAPSRRRSAQSWLKKRVVASGWSGEGEADADDEAEQQEAPAQHPAEQRGPALRRARRGGDEMDRGRARRSSAAGGRGSAPSRR